MKKLINKDNKKFSIDFAAEQLARRFIKQIEWKRKNKDKMRMKEHV